MKKRAVVLTLLLASLAIGLGFGLPLVTGAEGEVTNFDLSQGIVGNLDYECRVNGNCTWCDFIGLFIVLQKVILSLFAGLALIMIIWGGQGMIMAAGNQEKFTAGRKLITSTLFGVLIVLVGYFLINILVGLLITPAGTGPLKTKIWDKEWWQAECITKDEQCWEDKTVKNAEGKDVTVNVPKEDGKSCDITQPDKTDKPKIKGVCSQGYCVSVNECTIKYGQSGLTCRDVANCKAGTLDNCNINNNCYKGLCPGAANIVCCL
ncbi:MAG: hypothetical protein HY974_04795 [Candidatus Kerfeldbacteria bacterium]|nr:hypothetical protein [Candidatus Kerfeldbacteria bacterium]